MWIDDAGMRMAFSHNGALTGGGNPEGNYEIFTIALGDLTPRQVTSTVTGDSGAANISGDGSTIVFHSTAVLDGANEPLPAYLTGCLANSPARAGLSAVLMPWRIPTLVHLARRASQAESSLTRFGLAFIEGWSGAAPAKAAAPAVVGEGVLV